MSEGRRRGLDLSSPTLLYAAVWLSTYAGLQMGYLTFLEPVRPLTTDLIAATIAIVLAVELGVNFLRSPGERPAWGPECIDGLRLARNVIIAVAAAGFLVEVAVFPGVPLMYTLAGDPTRTYAEFGFPTVHGLLIALFLVSSSISVLLHLERPTGTSRAIILLHVFWTVLMLNRGALVWLLLEGFCLYLVRKSPSLKNLGILFATCVAGVLFFGFLGDLRLGSNARFFDALISEHAPWWFRDGPSGLVWVYTYLVTSMNNLNAAIAVVEPTNTLYWSTVNLLPSVVRTIVYDDFIPRYALPLAIDAFNTSTFYATYWHDFGFTGAVAAFGVLALGATVFHAGALSGSVPATLAYAVLGRAILLTIFWDTATSLVTLFQLAVVVMMTIAFARSGVIPAAGLSKGRTE